MAAIKFTGEKDDPLIEEMNRCVPRFGHHMNKGAAGRVAVIGGSASYTGAPYFASMSALRSGADLVYVFTSSLSAIPIKSYSPELIVYPNLEEASFVDIFIERLSAFTSVIIGPGLGRPGDVLSIEKFNRIIENLKRSKFPVVLDADGVSFLSKNPNIIQGYKEAILTPNFREFKRLYSAVFGNEVAKDTPEIEDQDIKALANKLGNVTICCKNFNDKITDGSVIVVNGSNLGPRRCGGQGDIMSGVMGTFTHWCHQAYAVQQKELSTKKHPSKIQNIITPTIAAALVGSVLTRKAARLAFNKHHRATLAGNIVEEIDSAFNALFPTANNWTWT